MTNTISNDIQKPSWFLNLTEGFRSFFDWLGCIFFMLFHTYKNVGNAQPIMVVPGFLGTDAATYFLRRFLRKSGYTVYGWELGRNLGHITDLKTLAKTLKTISEKHQQKITLIGWSLGGVYVRELAKEQPHFVKQVITLGSPFSALQAPNHAAWIFNLINSIDDVDKVFLAQLPIPAPVKTTAFYSKQDGIVPWEACTESIEDNLHQNILVRSSHLGFCFNAQVFKTIAKVL